MKKYLKSISFLTLFSLWLIWGLSAACSGDKTCKTNADCEKGEICSQPTKKCIQPECRSNLDCKDDEACVKSSGKCEKRGQEGDSCTEDGAGCLGDLLCVKGRCTKKCTTEFDCDKGETCDTETGICTSNSSGTDGGDNTNEGDLGQGIGESCSLQQCRSSLDCVKFNDKIKKCWKPCQKDSDCQDQRICASGHCVPQGEQCLYDKPGGTLTKPCWAGLECALDGIVEGKCLRPCKGGDCPAGLKCIEDKGKKFCRKETDKAGPHEACGDVNGKKVDCVSGYACLPKSIHSKQKVCTKTCTKADDCQWPYFCQGGYCVAGNVGSAKLGEVCSTANGATEDKICDVKLYCQVSDPKAKEGRCYRDCTDPKAEACPNGTSCQVLSTNPPRKLCLKTCAKPEDCDQNTQKCVKLPSGAQVCIHK